MTSAHRETTDVRSDNNACVSRISSFHTVRYEHKCVVHVKRKSCIPPRGTSSSHCDWRAAKERVRTEADNTEKYFDIRENRTSTPIAPREAPLNKYNKKTMQPIIERDSRFAARARPLH